MVYANELSRDSQLLKDRIREGMNEVNEPISFVKCTMSLLSDRINIRDGS